MSTASAAFRNLMGATAQLANTTTTTIVAVDNVVQYLGSYAQELKEERFMEAAINAADREERVLAQKAVEIVEAQESILTWMAGNPARQELYTQQLESLKQRLRK